ncbi:uncharacterized protein [Diadema antillarum]|uniref:uncharacterized protein n=1 Tax=Diadema antillarum TaxID=105358 RepID=UPI003A87E724
MTQVKEFLDWFIAFRDPREIWANHQSFLIAEITYHILAVLLVTHAFRHGGRFAWYLLAIFIHGLVVESISYILPDIDNFWHAQGTVMLLAKRLPTYIICVYYMFMYPSFVAVSRLRLPTWSEPFAHALVTVLLDIPYDIMGIKHMWWTWHDTDPNIYDRYYWVPITSFFFWATFMCSHNFLFFAVPRWFGSKAGKYESNSMFVELVSAAVAGVFAFPLGTIQFIIIYHIPHDLYGVSTGICLGVLFAVYVLMVWIGDRNPGEGARPFGKHGSAPLFDNIGIAVTVHYLLYIVLVFFTTPASYQSIGLHEETGNCQDTTSMYTALGKIVHKKKYLCTSNYDEAYFDWHCLPGQRPPQDYSRWYTICGNDYPNHFEYCMLVTAHALFGFLVYYQMLSRSGKNIDPSKMYKLKTK